MQLLGSTRIRTTAYHPSSNGMIERFHRQLKAAIKAYPSPDRWTEALPMVLLGIRTCLKSDLGCSTAELVYGTTLKLPGDFFITPTPNSIPDPSSYVDRVKSGGTYGRSVCLLAKCLKTDCYIEPWRPDLTCIGGCINLFLHGRGAD